MKHLLVVDNLSVMRKKPPKSLLTTEQKSEIIHLLGDAGYLLYTYFYDAYQHKKDPGDDAHIAAQLGWTERKVANTRREIDRKISKLT